MFGRRPDDDVVVSQISGVATIRPIEPDRCERQEFHNSRWIKYIVQESDGTL